MALKKLESKVKYRISRSKNAVFMLPDFLDISDKDQIGRVLRKMVSQGMLVKIGYGVYSKARVSTVSGAIIPVKPLPELAREVIIKLGLELRPSKAEQAYNSGRSTQVPTGRVIAVKGRISRKIEYAGNKIVIDNAA